MDLQLANAKSGGYIRLVFASSRVLQLYSSHPCTFQDPANVKCNMIEVYIDEFN